MFPTEAYLYAVLDVGLTKWWLNVPQINHLKIRAPHKIFGWLVVLGLTAVSDSISVYIGPSPRERERKEKG